MNTWIEEKKGRKKESVIANINTTSCFQGILTYPASCNKGECPYNHCGKFLNEWDVICIIKKIYELFQPLSIFQTNFFPVLNIVLIREAS